MKMKAALVYEPNAPLKIEEIDIAGPKEGEVMVKIEAVGLCHTDLHFHKRDIPAPLPMVLGHEGAGIVESVGPGVTAFKPGDHVMAGVILACGKCLRCLSGQSYWCENAGAPMMAGMPFDMTPRLTKDGAPVFVAFAQGSFAQYAIVKDTCLAKVRDDAPFDKICGLGCGLGTGVGATINNPRFTIPLGSSIVIFGCGAVGLSAVMGAKLTNAKHIVAVDVLDSKLEMAKQLGATMVVNSSREMPVPTITQKIGPVDFAFDCVGKPELIQQCFSVTKGPGITVVVGATPVGYSVALDCFSFIHGKMVVGVSAGFMRPAFDFPRLVDLYMDGKFPVDKLVTHHFSLDNINEAIHALKSGEAIKAVIHPWS